MQENIVTYEEYLDVKNQPDEENTKILIEQATDECVMQIAFNAKENMSIETEDLGNGKTRVRVRMKLVPA